MTLMKIQKINHLKHVFIERLGSECAGEDRPFYLELLSYDARINDKGFI